MEVHGTSQYRAIFRHYYRPLAADFKIHAWWEPHAVHKETPRRGSSWSGMFPSLHGIPSSPVFLATRDRGCYQSPSLLQCCSWKLERGK
jgi:hypothetical protein